MTEPGARPEKPREQALEYRISRARKSKKIAAIAHDKVGGYKTVMSTIAVDVAQKQLPELIRRARGGEEIIITDGERPVVRLEPIEDARRPRVPGRLKGKLKVPERLFDPLPPEELERCWGARA
jgi:antitoxin (DNA-binding transcriptional repressor) of toxin-antitoxin stability system